MTASALFHCTESLRLHFFSPPQFLSHSLFLSLALSLSLHQWVPQILFARSKWLCVQRQRKKECVGDRDAGESGRWGGGRIEQRRAVVMSHLLQADRMAEESWHVPHGGRRMGRKLNVWEGRKGFFNQSAPFICERRTSCRVFRHESRSDTEREHDSNSVQFETEPCGKQKERGKPQMLFESCMENLCTTCVCGFRTI